MSAVYLIDGERGKRCSGCETVKPLSGFYARKGRGDGHQSQCKGCQKARLPRYRAENPELWARIYRESSRRVVRDPERGPIRRAYEREYMRRVRGTRPENFKVGEAPDVRVPSAPVRAAVEASPLTLAEIAKRAGRDREGIKRALRSERMTVASALAVLDALDLVPAEVGL